MTAILLVEDDDESREMMSYVLEGEGYEVHAAENGQVALDMLHQLSPPAAIITDLMMPVMDGAALLDEMKGDPKLASIPVIVVSAAGASQAGRADDFVAKPVDASVLLSAIGRHCAPERQGVTH